MIELFPRVYYVPGSNKSTFPYCACLYLEGRDLRVLVDVGMGKKNIAPVKARGVDLVLLTHSHIDHHLTKPELPGTPFWCHPAEVPYIGDKERYLEATGITRSGFDFFKLRVGIDAVFDLGVSRTIEDGETLDLGGLTLVALHTPGHTPGHLAVYVPEHDFLFSGDVDLTRFGPFYGHDFADLDDTVASIDRLRRLGAKVVATGHSGPFTDALDERFRAYRSVVDHRDRMILDFLGVRPRGLQDFAHQNIVYHSYGDPAELMVWFELVSIEKHLVRMERQGWVRREGEMWMAG